MQNNFDFFIELFFTKIQSEHLTTFFRFITKFGNAEYIAVFCIIFVIYLFLYKKKNFISPFVFLIGFSVLAGLVLKVTIKKPRPLNQLILSTGFSWPSLHSIIAVSFYGFLIFFLQKQNIQKKWKIFFQTFLGLLIIAICISRIYLRAHFATDVLAGLLIGGISFFFAIKVIKK